MRPPAMLLMTVLAGTGCSMFASLDGLSGGDEEIAPQAEAGVDRGSAQTTAPVDASADAGTPGSPTSPSDAATEDTGGPPLPVTCTSTGFRTGLTGTNLGAGTPWAEPNNGLDVDGKKAEALLAASSADSAFLRVSRFELGIPSGATIRGITVRVKRDASAGGIRDAEVRLAPSAQVAGSNRQTTPVSWGAETVAYGDANDLWGLALTPAIMNGDEFGVAIKARFTNTAGNARARVDAVELDVAYCQ